MIFFPPQAVKYLGVLPCGCFASLTDGGPSLSRVEKAFQCWGAAWAADGKAPRESRFLEGLVLTEVLLVLSACCFQPAFLHPGSKEVERERVIGYRK